MTQREPDNDQPRPSPRRQPHFPRRPRVDEMAAVQPAAPPMRASGSGPSRRSHALRRLRRAPAHEPAATVLHRQSPPRPGSRGPRWTRPGSHDCIRRWHRRSSRPRVASRVVDVHGGELGPVVVVFQATGDPQLALVLGDCGRLQADREIRQPFPRPGLRGACSARPRPGVRPGTDRPPHHADQGQCRQRGRSHLPPAAPAPGGSNLELVGPVRRGRARRWAVACHAWLSTPRVVRGGSRPDSPRSAGGSCRSEGDAVLRLWIHHEGAAVPLGEHRADQRDPGRAAGQQHRSQRLRCWT